MPTQQQPKPMTEAQIITSLIGMGGIAITCLVLVTSFKFQGQ